MKNEWITLYSTYHLSRYSTEPREIVECENKDCKKKFVTNINRKRCSKECAKKARKQNKNSPTENNKLKNKCTKVRQIKLKAVDLCIKIKQLKNENTPHIRHTRTAREINLTRC